MATNLAIDDRLLEEALLIGGQRTKKATVTEALQEIHSTSQTGKDPTARFTRFAAVLPIALHEMTA